MDPKVIQLLDQLSVKLGLASDTAWEALLWQARMHSILISSLLSVTGVIIGLACLYTYKKWEWIKGRNAEPLVMLLLLPVLFWWVAFFINIESLLTATFNPEAWAICRLLGPLG